MQVALKEKKWNLLLKTKEDKTPHLRLNSIHVSLLFWTAICFSNWGLFMNATLKGEREGKPLASIET